MRQTKGYQPWQQLLALLLCYLLSPAGVLAVPEPFAAGPGQPAGQITALIPGATRNDSAAKLKDDIRWNDIIDTNASGRARVGLADGSILSVGSASELKVIQHDPGSQQTQLALNYGKIRSRVVSITKPDGKFEVKTPNAVARVVGTDFTSEFDPQNGVTTVIVYSGIVTVSGIGSKAGQTATVPAGQMVQIAKNGLGQPQPTPASLQQESIIATTTEGGSSTAAGGSHFLRNVLIGLGVAVASVAIGVGASSSATPTPTATASSEHK